MRFIVLLLALTGCGADNSKGSNPAPAASPEAAASTAAVVDPEVTRVDLKEVTCFDKCTVSVEAMSPAMGFMAVVAYGEGTAPATCTSDNTQVLAPYNFAEIERLEPGKTYGFRVCAWNSAAGYTAGITRSLTTVAD